MFQQQLLSFLPGKSVDMESATWLHRCPMFVKSVKVLWNYLRNSRNVHSTYSAFLLITTTTANNNILRIIGLPRTSRNCIKHTSGYNESSIRTDGGGCGTEAAAGSYWGKESTGRTVVGFTWVWGIYSLPRKSVPFLSYVSFARNVAIDIYALSNLNPGK